MLPTLVSDVRSKTDRSVTTQGLKPRPKNGQGLAELQAMIVNHRDHPAIVFTFLFSVDETELFSSVFHLLDWHSEVHHSLVHPRERSQACERLE